MTPISGVGLRGLKRVAVVPYAGKVMLHQAASKA
jgi:hypothetical protein